MVNEASRRVCLRAEIRAGGQVIIAHTREISPASVVVVGESIAAVGEQVHLKLSLPRHVAPLSFHGTVIELAGSGTAGDPGTVRVLFDGITLASARGLAELLQRLDESSNVGVGGAAYRVLIVDESEMMRELFSYGVRKYFRRWGSQVVVDGANDGLAAWRLLEEAPYQLALVSRYLPVLDGARLVERIRARPELADMLIIGVSGDGRDATDAMLNAGVDLCLAKPVVLRDVFSTLDSLTQRGLGMVNAHDGSQEGSDPRR